jgi:hypothetical protein
MRLEDIPFKRVSGGWYGYEVPCRTRWVMFDNQNGTYDFIKHGKIEEDHVGVDALTAQCLLHAMLAGEI